jgi:hypothetical protein
LAYNPDGRSSRAGRQAFFRSDAVALLGEPGTRVAWERRHGMGIIHDLLQLIIPAVVLALIPILFILIFDIGAHLRELFGRR